MLNLPAKESDGLGYHFLSSTIHICDMWSEAGALTTSPIIRETQPLEMWLLVALIELMNQD
jgi:hypothetical protein